MTVVYSVPASSDCHQTVGNGLRALAPVMNERMRRQWAAAEAQAYGWGGVRAVSATIEMSVNTIRRGLQELAEREAHPEAAASGRVRRPGGGRKSQTEIDPGLSGALARLIEPAMRGDPESPLRWTCQSTPTFGHRTDGSGTSGRRQHGVALVERRWLQLVK